MGNVKKGRIRRGRWIIFKRVYIVVDSFLI